MSEWWDGLSSVQQFFYSISIPSTIILVIQFILSAIGIGSHDDVDIGNSMDPSVDGDLPDHDFSVESDVADFRFVTFRGIIAFLTIFGWVGAVLVSGDVNTAIAFIISTISGFIAMGFVAYMFYVVSKLQSSGNLDYKKAIGGFGEVYIPIPPNNSGMGKIQLTVSGQLIEADAITHLGEAIKTGEIVRIVDIFNGTIYVVEKDSN